MTDTTETQKPKRSHKKKVSAVVAPPAFIETEDEIIYNPGANGHVPEDIPEDLIDEEIERDLQDEEDDDFWGTDEGTDDSGPWDAGSSFDPAPEVDDTFGEESQEYVRKQTKKQLQASDILSRAMKITAKTPKMTAKKVEKPVKAEKAPKEPKVLYPISYELPEQYQFSDYETGVAILSELTRRNSLSNWEIGWMVIGIPTQYGKKTIEEIAKAVGIAKATLNLLRYVAQAFSPENVAEFPNLTFSHFKIMAKTALTDIEEAMAVLEMAATQGWSVDMLAAHMAKTPTETRKPLVVPGGQLMIARNAGELGLVALPEGWTAFVYITDSGSEGWYKSADEAGVLSGLVKASFKAITD